MTFPFRLISVVLFLVFVSACQPRIQPIYVPSSVALPAGLETTPLSDIRDGILDAGAAKGWKMKELEPGVIRGTLDVQNKHQAVVDVVYSNQSFAINYVSSRNLLSQDGNIHRSYNAWIRRLETNISTNLSYLSSQQLAAKNAPATSSQTGTPAFDPAGLWNVSATYTPTAVSSAFCPTKSKWTFRLDYRKRGGISHTYWSNGVQLNVTGEHSADRSDLVFSVPDGGSEWQLTQRLKLDSPEVRLTSEAKSSTSSTTSSHPSNCIGVIDVIMKKLNRTVAARPAPAPVPSVTTPPAPVASTPTPTPTPTPSTAAAAQEVFSVKGHWNVLASYIPTASNSSRCPKAADWDFTLELKNGKISETYYSNRKALFVSGEMDNDYLDLRFDVPSGGQDWKWTERFSLNQPEKRLTSIAQGGNCTGTLKIHMKKQSGPAASRTVPAPVPSVKTTPAPVPTPKPASPPVATTATAADIAWRNLEDKKDPAALRQFLKEHLDSKYAAVAIQNLNKAMAQSSPIVVTGQKPVGFDPSGNWRVTSEYTGAAANTSSCPQNPRWAFILTFPDDNLSKRIWDGANDIYINNESYNGNIQLKIVFPRGGGDWKWANRFSLDQNRKTFLSESHGFGGTYGTCTGKLVFTMHKIN